MSALPALTPTQGAILSYLESSIDQKGYPPSIREIGSKFGIDSPNGVICHLKALEKKGYLLREKGKSRAIALLPREGQPGTPKGKNFSAVFPLYGVVAAGPAIEAVPTPEMADIGAMLGGEGHFALKVKGDSMIESHIEEGDLVILKHQETARNGDIVVVMIDGAVTLKKFYHFKDRNKIVLEPANSNLDPIELSPEQDVKVIGKLIGVVRKH